MNARQIDADEKGLHVQAREAAAVSFAHPDHSTRPPAAVHQRLREQGDDSRSAGQQSAESAGHILRPEVVLPHLEMLLRTRIGPEKLGRYLQGGRAIAVENDRLIVRAPSPLVASIIDRHFISVITDSAREVTRNLSLTVAIVVTGQLEPTGGATPGTAPKAPATTSIRQARPRALASTPVRHKFDDFIVSDGTRIALESARRHARGEGAAGVLFIHGSVGMGKTHLLWAAAAEAQAVAPGAIVRVLTAEQFTNEYIGAVRTSKMDEFRPRYRRCDLLCIDDVQSLQGKASTQQELQQTIDAVLQRGGRVMVTAAVAPRQLEHVAEAVVSRLSSGMVASLGKLDEHAARRAIAVLAQRRAMTIEPAALEAMARWALMPSPGEHGARCVSMRDLEGLVTKVDAVHRLLGNVSGGASVGMICVEQALRGGSTTIGSIRLPGGVAPATMQNGGPRIVKAEEVVQLVCRRMHVDRPDLSSRTRHPRVVLARGMIVLLCRKLTTLSFPEIARVIGRPNHSTVITAVQRIQKQVDAGQRIDLGSAVGGEVGLDHLAQTLEAELRSA